MKSASTTQVSTTRQHLLSGVVVVGNQGLAAGQTWSSIYCDAVEWKAGGFRVRYNRRPTNGPGMCYHGTSPRPSRRADHRNCRSMGLGNVRDCLLTRCRMLMNVYRENKKCFHLQQGHEGRGWGRLDKQFAQSAHAACRCSAEQVLAQHAL